MSAPRRSFTAIDNEILSLMSVIEKSELCIMLAVSRRTVGWQKDKDRISLSQFEADCKLSRQGVIDGIKAAIDHGILKRHQVKGTQNYEYEINDKGLVGALDRIKTSQLSRLVNAKTSQLSRPDLVNSVDRLGEKLVNSVDTQYKEIKENKQKALPAAQTQPPPPAGADAPCVPSEHNAMDNNHEKFCLPDEAKRNRRIIETITRDATETSMVLSFLGFLPLQLTKTSAKTQVAAARDIIGGGGTEADLRRAWLDSRGQNGQRPFTVNDLHSLKGRALAIAAERRSKPAQITQGEYVVEYN